MRIKVGKTNFEINDDSISSLMTHTSAYDENHHCLRTLTVGPLTQKVKTTYQYDDKNRLKSSTTFVISDNKKMKATASPSVTTKLFYDNQDRIIRMVYEDYKLNVNDVHEVRYTYTPTEFGTMISTSQYAGDGHVISTVGFNENLQKEVYRFDKDEVVKKIKYYKEGDDIIEKKYSKTDKSSTIIISKYEYDGKTKKHYLVYYIDSNFNFKLENFDTITVDEVKKQGYEREIKYSYSDDHRILSRYCKYHDINGEVIETNDDYKYDESGLVSIISNIIFEDGKTYSSTAKYFVFKPTSSDSSVFDDHHKYYVCKDNGVIFIQDYPFIDNPLYNDTIFENETRKQYVIGYADASGQNRFSIVSQNRDRMIKYDYSDTDSFISYKTPTHYYEISVQRVLDQSGKAIMLSNINICNYKNSDKVSDDRFITINEPVPTFSMIDHLLKVARIDNRAKQIQAIITKLSRDWER